MQDSHPPTSNQAPAPSHWPDAHASDPRTLGWMQGSPPPADKMVRFDDGSFLRFPELRWSLSHLRELVPTTAIARAPGAPSALPLALRDDLHDLRFTSMHGESMSWREALLRTYYDGILVLHRGRVVQEDYFGEGAPERGHALFSVTKSFVGTLAALAVHQGRLDPQQPVTAWLPELRASAYGSASVRQVMDMLIGLDYSEDYADPTAGIWDFSRAGGLLPRPEGYAGPRSYGEYLATLRQLGEHGTAFAYKTVNTQVLGWLLERLQGQRLAEQISQQLWQPLGTAHDASISLDATGAAFGGGGMNATVRDLARFGEMMRLRGRFNGQQVLPEVVVADIEAGGQRSHFAQAEGYRATLPGWSYRSMWWVSHNAHGAYMARGVHGQCIYIDPTAEMVIVRTGSHPVASGVGNDPITLPAFAAVADALMRG